MIQNIAAVVAILLGLTLTAKESYDLGKFKESEHAIKLEFSPPLPPILPAPIINKTVLPHKWQISLACSEAALCGGEDGSWQTNKAWTISCLTIDGRNKEIYGNMDCRDEKLHKRTSTPNK